MRTSYADWQREEAGLTRRLWPNLSASAAWAPGGYKQAFLPWRGSAQRRSGMEARLLSRIRAWQAIQDEQDAAVAEAQRVALPVLRDRLLGISDLPSTQRFLNNLVERWLMDFGASGATITTPIEQAIASLQTLINGVQSRWFETGHPASVWNAGTDFNTQWPGIDTFGRWQTSVLSHLYPERALYPELRRSNSQKFKTLLEELGKLQPISSEAIRNPTSAVGAAWSAVFVAGQPSSATTEEKAEALVFAPLAIGLALQRAGLYSSALYWYGTFYDRQQNLQYRKRYEPLTSEQDSLPPVVDFGNPIWARNLDDPHSIARTSGCKNPYTRFVLFQILHCLLAQADDAFAAGTRDDRTRALGLYLEASEVLDFEELRDQQPANPLEAAYLPSPILTSLRAHTDSALRKLRRGLNFLGFPMPQDMTRGSTGVSLSSLVRPTPYRYKVLIERAKQLVAQSQQLESQYLAAMEGGDRAAEQLLSQGFQLESAQQTITLRRMQKDEASDGLVLAQRQQERSRIQRDRYQQWIVVGSTTNEQAQLENIWSANTARGVIAGIDATLTGLQAFGGIANLIDTLSSFGAELANAGSIALVAAGRGVAQGFLNDNETRSQVSGILAAQERRLQEWQLSRDLANQDAAIGQTQITLANDRVLIAAQEFTIAQMQASQALQMLAFLRNKTTSAFFYQWLQGELRNIYVTFLRLATATARNAELQLAFEHQVQAAGFVRADYWQLASASASAASGNISGSGNASPAIEAKGITGSARLLQDIYLLDERAFSSERRLLNLSQSFSLARLMPIEFEEFRRTGQLTFSTPMRWFDEGFPGHYMRMIKKVRVSITALIPPSQGIRATLASSGMSRVVTADAGYPTVVIRQDPQLVALTSPIASTGVFELDMQSDLLYPFEGTGVDTTWSLELPPAGNPFDFGTLMDVVVMIDYTAQFSPELRERVVKTLPRQFVGDQVFSVKRDLPDVWYELANGHDNPVKVKLSVSSRHFPTGLSDIGIQEIAVSARSTDGKPCAYRSALTVMPPGLEFDCGSVTSVRGIASTRQSGGAGWRSIINGLPKLEPESVSWEWKFSSVPAIGPSDPDPILTQLRDGKVDDILIVMTFSGTRPYW